MPDFSIATSGDPQKTFTRWTATPDDGSASFLIGQTVSFNDGDGSHRGLYQTRVLQEIPSLVYDRKASEAELGLWAHFIWPTVVAESVGGHHLLVNTYDRARFTFGFYQLAAHTPNDNLILLFRELLLLPKAQAYFPDLTLRNGKVHRIENGAAKSLEVVTNVHRPNGKFEDQIVGFMTYLNPDTTSAGSSEAANAARLMHWLMNDKDAVAASVRIAVQILRKKVRNQAAVYKLQGKDPRLAIWVSDISHQGRGSSASIKAALAEPNVAAQLSALAAIGAADFPTRIASVKASIKTLTNEGAFAGVTLGDQSLPL
ncbi:MAG: hypothetical protein IOC49_01720 [Methylobacterium sp.]|nr:hypothetical protein [Methylobacterium sp.]